MPSTACLTLFARYTVSELYGKSLGAFIPPPWKEEEVPSAEDYQFFGPKKVLGKLQQVLAFNKQGQSFYVNLSMTELYALDGYALPQPAPQIIR
jgi:hypothetical protein